MCFMRRAYARSSASRAPVALPLGLVISDSGLFFRELWQGNQKRFPWLGGRLAFSPMPKFSNTLKQVSHRTECFVHDMTGSSKLFPDGLTQGLVHHYKNFLAADILGDPNPSISYDKDKDSEDKALGTTSRNESFEDAIEVGDHNVKLDDGNEVNPESNSESKVPWGSASVLCAYVTPCFDDAIAQGLLPFPQCLPYFVDVWGPHIRPCRNYVLVSHFLDCFTKTDLSHVYYYEKCLAWIQVIFWCSMLMYKISGSSLRSTRPTITWALVRGSSDCSILDNISHACCA